MRHLVLLLTAGLVGLVAPSFTVAELAADEIMGTLAAKQAAAERKVEIESLLAAWSKASREVRSYDVKMMVYSYDHIGGDIIPRTTTEGRMLFQRDGASRWSAHNGDGYIWRDGAIVIFEPSRRSCRLLTAEALAEAKRDQAEPSRRRKDLFDQDYPDLALRYFAEPAIVIPFLLSDIERFRADYELDLDRDGDRFFLRGTAKLAGAAAYRRIAFTFEPSSPLPCGMHIHIGGGKKISFQPIDPKFDAVPPDAAIFLNPDSTGLNNR